MRAPSMLAGPLLAALAAMSPALAQPRQSPPLQRPAWAADIPAQVPVDAVGVFAYLPAPRQSFCQIAVIVLNNTRTTIRTAHAQVEVFWGDRSVVGSFNVQFVDPEKHREARVHLVEGCRTQPSRIVVRDVGLCSTGEGIFPRPACGLSWLPFAPAVERPAIMIPVSFAPDFRR
jgi:hypothetical protein